MTSARNAPDPRDDSISLLSLWQILYADRRLFIAIVATFAVLAVILALVMTPVYRAEAVVAPVDVNRRDSGVPALLNQFGGLASLAGINLSGMSSSANKGRVIIQSRSLLEQFIKQNNLIAVMFPEERDAPPEARPTLWRAVEEFKDHYDATEDPDTGLITVGVEWTDQQVAAKWANDLVKLSNALLRQQALADSQGNLKYLNDQLARTNVLGLQEAIYNLIEGEMRTLMLANAREEYALAFVDRAVAPELRARPKRKQLVVLGILLGGIVGVFVVAIRRTVRTQRQRAQAQQPSTRTAGSDATSG